MTICEFCGKEIPDGGICSCDEALAAAENMPGVSDEIYGDDAEMSLISWIIHKDLYIRKKKANTNRSRLTLSMKAMLSLNSIIQNAPPYSRR